MEMDKADARARKDAKKVMLRSKRQEHQLWLL